DHEKELGVAMIDMGGGTSDILILHNGAIRHTSVIGLGGNSITDDLAFGLSAPNEEAERLKKTFGCAIEDEGEDLDADIEVKGVGGRKPRSVTKAVLNRIIQPRVEEILMLIFRDIKKTDFVDLLGAGIVMTGGGSLLRNIDILAEQIFEKPTRIGIPKGFGGLTNPAADPQYATGIGLCMYAFEHDQEGSISTPLKQDSFKVIVDKMKNWIKEFF
ncbi:MAG: cell division protein FtsA, partial [Candidatus Delongbacteria bacterium]|nr:cell division protein FtsA [Candidatus Delongbacteria bacterium]